MLLGGGFRFGTQAMADALDATLKRLGTDQVDLYQVHFPFPTYPQEVCHCVTIDPAAWNLTFAWEGYTE